MVPTRFAAAALMAAALVTAGAAAQKKPAKPAQKPAPAPVQTAPEDGDVPTMTSGDASGERPNRYTYNEKVPPNLTLNQLPSYAEKRNIQFYSMAGLRLLALRASESETEASSRRYGSSSGYNYGPWPLDVFEPATQTTSYGMSSSTFSFYVSDPDLVGEIRSYMKIYKNNEVRLNFDVDSTYVGRGRRFVGKVTRVSWLDERGRVLDEAVSLKY